MRFALATDVGGGSSFSMLRTMAEAYKVAQLLGQQLSPLRAFYLATLAGARMLGLADRIGRFGAGHRSRFYRARSAGDAAAGATHSASRAA